jgi:septation ring formation regulator EzrA
MREPANPINRINRLYSKGLNLIERDMNAIDMLSRFSKEKLPTSAAKDLRDYIKLLSDMAKEHVKIQADLAALAKANDKAKTDEELLRAVAGAGVGPSSTPALDVLSSIPSND